jgi:DNA-binding beta-propeller fold protein YncE
MPRLPEKLPPGSGSITTGGGYVWVSMQGAPVTQIDPKTNSLIRTFIGGHGMGGYIRFGAGSLWVAGGRISRLEPPN